MNRLSTTFGRTSFGLRANSPLSDDQLYGIAPSIFAVNKHESRSERYTYIPTIEVLNGLRQEGFQPFMVAQSRSRIEGKSDFTKHMIRLRTAEKINSPEAFEIILINSHDGTSSYQMLAGVFRFVCQNGMVTGDMINDIRVPHRGNITDNVIDAAFTISDEFEIIDKSLHEMKSTFLTPEESDIFATAALGLKYEDANQPITPNQLLIPRRLADTQPDLWSVSNKIQENLIRGGLHGHSSNGRKTRTRAVKSIDTNIKLNKSLWILTQKMMELKNENKGCLK